MPVYSVRFLAGVSSIGSIDIPTYTVPAGHVAVVRDIDLVLGTSGSAPIFTGANGNWLVRWVAGAANEVKSWRGRQVYEAGEQFAMYMDHQVTHYQVSGYLLTA